MTGPNPRDHEDFVGPEHHESFMITGQEPLLRVERGSPTPEELAALVAVVAARRAAASEAGRTSGKASRWATYWRTTNRAAQRPGQGAWRSRGTGR